ncbi:hypothetical protein [Aliiglaciecola lipolytica]|uniref:hypothetical protein n=1 Tax=Aliiglaciecola lipolytica TaxID=477689 RepID=UPI001C086BC0|nr:hypothetical protein [Aliiglaciecola lipolytica]MBU2879139.1 hypothetical protein [Aliiglaciecola lipolytica]
MSYYLSLFTEMEKFLLLFCPIAGMIGGFIHMLILDFDWNKVPELTLTNTPKKEQPKLVITNESSTKRGGWYFARICLGVVAGLIVFLFVHGSITDTAAAASKVLILAFFGGLTAPSLFKELEQKYKLKLKDEIGGK